MASNQIPVEKRLIEDQIYYSLSDLAQIKSKQKPNEVLRNWINLPNTIEFIEVWEQKNNPTFRADSYIRFKINHYNSKRLWSLYEFIRRMQTFGLKSINEGKTGIFAHGEIAIEFVCWMEPQLKLQLVHTFKRYSEKTTPRDKDFFGLFFK